MSTNGYEIRLELLKMAKEMLEQDWHAKRDAVITDYHTRVQEAQSNQLSMPEKPTFEAFPTEAEIITKATALNGFITNRS